jgi:hypothetical protein
VYFAIERFLYRLAQTPLADRLVVKGATMLRAWGTPLARPTRDIDFMGSIENSPAAIVSAVRQCLDVVYRADGMVFAHEIVTEAITVADRYPGVRATVRGHLDGARFKLQLDIAANDVIVPDPGWVDYPTLLDLEAPRILAYMPVTAIAEKYDAMVKHGMANSRMKDFYDIWLLSRTLDLGGAELAAALRATFAHRETALAAAPPPALTAAFYDEPAVQARWAAFVSKSGEGVPADLDEVCAALSAFLMPVATAVAEGRQFVDVWIPGEGWSSSATG